jgi:hypothetical protein
VRDPGHDLEPGGWPGDADDGVAALQRIIDALHRVTSALGGGI